MRPRRYGKRACALAVLALVALGACQPLPRPFQPDDKRLNAADFARLGTRGGIIVTPPALDGTAHSAAFTGLLAAALRDSDIPAIAGSQGSANRYLFSGQASAENTSDRDTVVSSRWRLIDPRGTEVFAFELERPLSAVGWRTGDPATLALLAESVAAEAARKLSGAERDPQPAIQPDRRVAVWPVDGLSAPRSQTLVRAMEAALRTRGVSVAAQDDPDALVVTAWFTRALETSGERITMDWILTRPDGREIGVVQQSNVLAVGAIDQGWPEAAPAIAGAAADGLIEMIVLGPAAGS